ncbi:hypothetical protein FLLO111716_05365 [Flavobacterium longum]
MTVAATHVISAMEVLRFPLARLACGFIPGIVWSYVVRPEIAVVLTANALSLVLFLVAFWLARQSKWRSYFGAMLLLVGFGCGALCHCVHTFHHRKNHFRHFTTDGKPQQLMVVVSEKRKSSPKRTRFVAELLQIDGKPATGKILLQAAPEAHFAIGTKVLAFGEIIMNQPPLNPGQFDYGKYLDDQAIAAQFFLTEKNHQVTGLEKNLSHYADATRNRIIRTLRQSGFNERELQVLHALVLGQQQDISPDIVSDYQAAGAVHILSVSGLHMGFVLLFVNFLLNRLPRTRRYNLIRVAATVLLLWAFAFIAGLSASVVRAATMFSFVAIGNSLNRSANIYHTLLVSVLLILLLNPAFINDVGFQLSYAALFFIIWLQPALGALWTPKSKIVKYFWDIVTVSFAAQLGTLPLSIFYFHQFPMLFFVTNLVVIPMLSVIMGLAAVATIPAAFGCALPMLPDVLEKTIYIMNTVIGKVAALDDFVLRKIPCNSWMLIAAYLLLFAFGSWTRKPTAKRFVWIVAAAFALQVSTLASVKYHAMQQDFIVLQVPKQTVLIAQRNRKAVLYGHRVNAVSDLALHRFVSDVRQMKPARTFWFGRKKILLLKKGMPLPEAQPDVLILSESPQFNLERWLQNHRPEIIVADASNFNTDVVRWKATCRKRKIPFHYTREKGFFSLSE